METYHKIQTLFKRDMDGSRTGHKGKMIRGEWTTPALEYLADNEWEFTEKIDGTNIRIGFDHDGNHGHIIYGGRTDRAIIPKPLTTYLNDTFGTGLNPDPRWFNAFDGAGYVTLYGEGYGAGIQNGGNYQQAQEFVLFDVNIGGFWLERHNVDDIADKLGIRSVPVLGYGTLNDAIDIVSTGITFEPSGAVKRWGSGGLKSQWGNFEAEGIVARPKTPLFDRKGDRIITKIKGVDFQ